MLGRLLKVLKFKLEKIMNTNEQEEARKREENQRLQDFIIQQVIND